MHKVKWIYWDQNAGVPKGASKNHILADVDSDVTLCGIQLHGKDCEYGDAIEDCKICEKKYDKIMNPGDVPNAL